MFISEQVLYSKEELKQHSKSGDATGPLAESGFRGHPQCRFCRRSFYGDNELFAHMQREHYSCHVCLRRRGDYNYFRSAPDLVQHLRWRSRRACRVWGWCSVQVYGFR